MFFPLIEKRRSIRKYKTDPVEADKIEKLVEAALRSPSSRSLNPWEFIVVTDPQVLEKLSRSKPHGASFLKGAPLGIVVCADPARCDVWIEDSSIASIFIHLAATALDLGSCWIQIRERMHDETQSAESYIKGLLGIPQHLTVESMVAVGYPDEDKPPHDVSGLPYSKVHSEQYGIGYSRRSP